MLTTTLARTADLDALGARWRALETRCQGGFFRGWTFLGCQVETRFDDPHLLAVTADGVDVALGLLNRRRGRLHVGQTGAPAHDAVFIEHNGLLASLPVAALALRAAAARGPTILAGIDDDTLAAARAAGRVHVEQSRWAPAIDLAALDRPYLDTLSVNARAQIRRAIRLCGDDLRLDAAPDTATALAYFERLVALHQASWARRGRPGAFAAHKMRDFHTALIARGHPRDEVDVLRVRGGGREVGYLYCFRHGGRVLSYQSGFAPAPDARHKPGLVCHALAIGHYAAAGLQTYDLLAGSDRYKTTLAQGGGQELHWATLYGSGSIRGAARSWAARLRALVGGGQRGGAGG